MDIAADKAAVVGMSGGVDSSVAALLLARKGWQVTGVGLILPRCGNGDSAVPAAELADARRVADMLGIGWREVDVRQRFEALVLDDFCRQYRMGRTPNPCVRCNHAVKFRSLLEVADELGAGHIATGHYACCGCNEATGRYELSAHAGAQDQSYFLFALSQDQLARAVFPLCGMSKDEARRVAADSGLHVSERAASQDLCFLPGRDYRALLRERASEMSSPGAIVHVSGRELGRHEGVAGYTIGQRRGLGVAWSEPLYVVGIDARENRVIVGEKSFVRRRSLIVDELNWIAFDRPPDPLHAHVRIRHRHTPAAALVTPGPDGRAVVQFDEPQEAPTPGQAAVFYDGALVLGGGLICEVAP